MRRYIDADILRKKIDEQMKSVPREVGRGAGTITSSGYGMMQAFQIIRSIIDSLQQEQPKENVEKVCGTCTYWQEGTLDRGICQAGEPHQTHSAETCEEWERHEEIPMKEQPSEDLEEAAENIYKTPFGIREEYFQAGAEWQKEQMLKDAVGARVNYYENIPGGSYVEIVADIPNPPGFRYKDKVKIIIVKEDWIWHISQQVATTIAKIAHRINVDGVHFAIVPLLAQMRQ